MAHEDPWKNAVEATDDEDDADFYFTAPSEKLPPRAVGNAPLNTPDTSFQNFDDSNSLDTTPKVGRSTLKAANQTNPPALEPMFEPSFPSEEFLSVVSQQVQQHSVSLIAAFSSQDGRSICRKLDHSNARSHVRLTLTL